MIFRRYPPITQAILNNLDYQSLERSKEASRELAKFFENDQFIWIQLIRRYHAHFGRFENTWKSVITNAPFELVKELSIATKEFFEIWGLKDVAPIQIAAQFGSFQLCKHVIEKSDEKNPAGFLGTTPLHTASMIGSVDIFRIIFEEISEKNPVSNIGWTPLHYAAEKGFVDICKLILDNVEDKYPLNNFDNTPKDLAAERNKKEVVKLYESY